ncbi:MAG: hypothetical protein ACREDH_00520, partial [Methylocella sp.]
MGKAQNPTALAIPPVPRKASGAHRKEQSPHSCSLRVISGKSTRDNTSERRLRGLSKQAKLLAWA